PRPRGGGAGLTSFPAGAPLRRTDPPPQGPAHGAARLASAGKNGRAAALRGGPRPRSGPPRLRRQAAPDRPRGANALPVLRQTVLPCLLPGLPALRGERGAGDVRWLIANTVVCPPTRRLRNGHHRANRAQMLPGLYPSLDESWSSGHASRASISCFGFAVGTGV